MSDKFFTANFNAKEVTDFLKKQYETLKDLSPLMKTARMFLKHTVDENFETEGTHTGDKWTEWSEDWKKQRIRMNRGGGKILALSGDLRRSITAKSGKDYAIAGTGQKYAAIHNFGFKSTVKKLSKRGRIFSAKMNMPQREFMRLNSAQIEELLAELYITAQDMLMEQEVRKRVYGE